MSGPERVMRAAERFQEERDAARAEVDRLREQLESRSSGDFARADLAAARVVDLEAEATKWKTLAMTLRGVCGQIVDNPLMKREDVQSRLLIAIQNYDKKG